MNLKKAIAKPMHNDITANMREYLKTNHFVSDFTSEYYGPNALMSASMNFYLFFLNSKLLQLQYNNVTIITPYTPFLTTE